MILNGGSRSEKLSEAEYHIIGRKMNGKPEMKIEGKLINVADYKPDPEFISKFEPQNEKIERIC